MADPIARHSFSGTGNKTVTFPNVASFLVFFNDGTTDITIKAGQFQTIVKGGDAFDERLDPFSKLSITGSGSYHGYVRVRGVG